MGGNIPDAGTVSNAMFADFVDNVVSDLLPGFTITNGTGYWQGEKEVVRILTVISDDDDRQTLSVCNLIAEMYKRQFRQQSVLVNVQQTAAQFV